MHRFAALAAVLALAAPAFAQQPRLAPHPAIPAYGQSVAIALADAGWPVYLPATRFKRAGTSIVIDFEYLPAQFGPFTPDFGPEPVRIGELPAGNYDVQARLHDIARDSAPMVIRTNLAVPPPGAWGLYLVPHQPQAFSATEVMVKSAAYFDPESMRASVSGNVVRIDFDYQADAPASGAAPAEMRAYGSVAIPPLAPGAYRVEGWGRPTTGGEYERYFTKDFTVAATVPVVEYYSRSLDHYFMSAGADEIALVDRGGRGDWMRTGHRFDAWARQADAPPGAVPVCRFYARGPNSHFYTGSAQECEYLKGLERERRAQAAARGDAFLEWGYEGIAFWALAPRDGTCGAGTVPVWRAYNGRAAEMDSNHRFTADATQRAAMSVGWVDEGAHLCAPA